MLVMRDGQGATLEIKGARVLDPLEGVDAILDVTVEDGVIAARKPTETPASRLAVSAREPSVAAESTTGSVFGIARMAQ